MPEEVLTLEGIETGHQTSLLKSDSILASEEVRNNDVQRILSLVKERKTNEAKTLMRGEHWPVTTVRTELWYGLVKLNQNFSKHTVVSMDYYRDTLKELRGDVPELDDDPVSLTFPTFVDPLHVTSYDLNTAGIKTATRIIQVLAYSFPAITYAPGIFPLTCLLLHYMPEEPAYVCMNALVSGKYLSQTKVSYETQWRTFVPLCKKYASASYSLFMKSEKSNLSVFENWSWFVLEDLPLEYVVRIMDCLLLEGPKVLYRFGLALFGSFTRDKAKSLKGTSRDSVMQAIRTYCRQMRYPPQKILREAFSIRGFSRSEIQRLKAKIEEQIKAGVFGASGEYSADPCGPPEDTDPQTPDCDSDSSSTIELWRKIEIKAGLCEFAGGQLIQSRSTEGIPSSAAQQAISMTSNTLSIKQLLILWGWLPMRITMYQPHLLYTTDVHGCSLSTLYNKAQAYEPTILIVKTLDGDIFGAYCSLPWSDRNAKNEMTGYRHTYFGTGETFLFSLYPECRRYPWVGKTSSKGVAHSEELFMAADSHMITVGGGNGQGLWIDSEIRYGKTERCDTFGNEPLTAKKDFEVQVLEVYGFTSEA